MSNVMINIASEFDSKGFKKAQSSTTALEKQAKKLGKTLLAAFSVGKITQYSKASVLAYAEDQKAAALLSNQLKNLGLAYAAVDVEKFISNLESQTGILDDELRPAFAQLARVTGTVAESQKLMALAFDVSRGAGIDYMSAVDAISKAYVGNLKGLKKLNLGLTDAQLKTMKFEDIVKKLNQQFGGAGAASIETYAGKIDRLQVATANAQETIGKGFIDAFTLIAQDGDFKNVISSIDNMATNVADTLVGIGAILDQVRNKFNAMPSWVKSLFRMTQETSLFSIVTGALQSEGSKAKVKQSQPQGISLFLAEQQAKTTNKILNANKKITLETKKQNAEKKAQLALDKANLVLGQAENLFDLERISVAAAMANQTLTENERKRLDIKKAMFDLEDAIATKDDAKIEAATKTLEKLLGQFTVLQKQDNILTTIKATYEGIGSDKNLINTANLQSALDLLRQLSAVTFAAVSDISKATSRGGMNEAINNAAFLGASGNDIANALLAALLQSGTPTPSALSTARYTGQAVDAYQAAMAEAQASINAANAFAASIAPGHKGVTIQITENAKNIVDVVMNTVTEQSASGTPPIVERVGGNLAW